MKGKGQGRPNSGKRAGRLSLYPVKPEDALRAFLETRVEAKKKRKKEDRKAALSSG